MIRIGLGVVLVWLLAALLARGVVSDLFALGSIRPDWLAMVVVYWALASGPAGGTLAGFVVGLVADADLGRGLGLQAGLMSLTGFGVGQAGRHLIRESPILQAVVLAIGTFFLGLTRGLALYGDQGTRAFFSLFLPVAATAAYTALFGPAVYWVIRQIGLPDPLGRVPESE